MRKLSCPPFPRTRPACPKISRLYFRTEPIRAFRLDLLPSQVCICFLQWNLYRFIWIVGYRCHSRVIVDLLSNNRSHQCPGITIKFRKKQIVVPFVLQLHWEDLRWRRAVHLSQPEKSQIPGMDERTRWSKIKLNFLCHSIWAKTSF